MKFTIYQESRIGQRKANQDRTAYCYSRDALLMAVADGMGGIAHGDMAAQVATQTLIQHFQRQARPALDDPPQFLAKTLRAAHYNIVEQTRARRLGTIPCTTIVACVIQHGTAYWAHAGDSRLYLLRGGRIALRTRDHSRVQELLTQGLIRPEDIPTHPERNRILTCLGGPLLPNPEYGKPRRLRDGDCLLLCTDGLWGPLENRHILTALGSAQTDLTRAAPALLTQAETLAGKTGDNLSLIALQWRDDSATTAPDEHTVFTQSLAADHYTAAPGSAGRHDLLDLTDDEIERTIAEINQSIRKFNK